MSREMILAAFQQLSDELAKSGAIGEICLFGGTVMVLAFTARVSTKDVDGVFHPTQAIREALKIVAEDQNLDKDWLNDGVKGFLSGRHETWQGNLPQYPNLRLTMPVPEYLLAMKCMASRIGDPGGDQSDIPDIKFLIKVLDLKTPEQVLDIVSRYYPPNRIPVKAQYLIEGLFEEGMV